MELPNVRPELVAEGAARFSVTSGLTALYAAVPLPPLTMYSATNYT